MKGQSGAAEFLSEDTGRPAWTDSPKRRACGRASEAGRYYILPPDAPRWICPELVVLVDSVLMMVLVVVGLVLMMVLLGVLMQMLLVVGSLLITRAGSSLIMMTAASPLLAEWTVFRRTWIYSGPFWGPLWGHTGPRLRGGSFSLSCCIDPLLTSSQLPRS
ncbi:unnamed protein product [Boreogadus saida]